MPNHPAYLLYLVFFSRSTSCRRRARDISCYPLFVISNENYEAMGRHIWQMRSLGVTYPVPVLAVAARKKAGLTQTTLAAILGMHRSTIAKLEQGYLPMDEGLVGRWAEACGADEDLLAHDLAAAS